MDYTFYIFTRLTRVKKYPEFSHFTDDKNNQSKIEVQEVEGAIITFKSRKAPGIDDVPNELIKDGGNKVRLEITILY